MEKDVMIEMNLKPDGKNESLRKEEPPKGYKKIFQSFFENTTIPAITLIKDEINIIWKYIWLLIVLASLGTAIYQTVEILKNYYRYPSYLTEVEIHNRSIFMPSLTLCSHDIINWKRVQETNHSILHIIEDEAAELRKNLTEFHLRLQMREILMKEVNAMTEEEQKKILVNDTDWLLGCKVIDAEYKNFTLDDKRYYALSYTSEFGTCKTINPGLEETSKLRIGKNSGMLILAEINPEIEFPYQVHNPGLSLSIHPAGTAPAFPWHKKLEIYSGELLQIGIKVKDIERLPSPYASKCVRGFEDVSKDIYESSPYQGKDTPYSYSSEECLATCISNLIREKKECYLTDVPINETTRSQNVKFCNDSDLNNILVDIEKECSHSCPKRCRELLYDWNPKSTALTERWALLMDALKRRKGVQNININNFIVIFIKLETDEYIYAKETPNYEPEDVFGFIGGNFGLWIGLSFLSVFEIIELFINLVTVIISKIRNKRRRKNYSKNDCYLINVT